MTFLLQFFQKNEVFSRSWYAFATVVVGIILLLDVFFQLPGIRTPFEASASILSPVQQGVEQVTRFPGRWVRRVQRQESELEKLRAQVFELQTQLLDQQQADSDTDATNAELTQAEYQRLPARFSRQTRVLLSHSYMFDIEAGSAQGVQTGDYIFAEGKLIGKVTIVHTQFSRVVTFLSPQFQVLARVENLTSGVMGSINGELQLREVPVNASVEKKQLVYTVGSLDEQLPKGVFIGEVVGVQRMPESATLSIQVDQLVDLDNVQVVTVRRF